MNTHKFPTVLMAIIGFLTICFIGFILTGCQSQTTSDRFMSAQNNVQTCIATIADMKVAMKTGVPARPQVMFQKEENALLFLVVEKMADQSAQMMQMQASNEMAVCDDAYIAMIHADSQKTSGLTGLGKTVVGVTGGLIGLGILADGLNDLSDSGGCCDGDQYNINGSRVVSNSGNGNSGGGGYGSISASGEGDIFGNATNDSGIQQAGIMPRGNPAQITGDTNVISPGQNPGDNLRPTATPLPTPLPTPTPTPAPSTIF